MMRILVTTALVAATLSALPQAANARPRMECRRVWVHHHLVRRCRPVPPPRHRYHRPPPRY